MTDQALADSADPSCKMFQASQGRVSQGELAFTMPCLHLTGYGPNLTLTGSGPDLAGPQIVAWSDIDLGWTRFDDSWP